MAPHNNFRAPAPGLAAPAPAGARPFAVVAPMGAVGGTSVQLAAAQKVEAPGWQAEGDEGNTEPNSRDCAQQPPQVQATSAAGPTMTSREISELTGKRHDNVMADARKMLVELYGPGGALSFQDTQVTQQNGQRYAIFRLPKRETLILVSGYSVSVRALVIDRLQELESGVAAVPKTLPEALRLAADMAELMAEAKATLAIAAPKAAGLDRIATASEGAVGVRLAAKLANVPERQFIGFLIEHGCLYRERASGGLLGTADKERAGWVETKRIELPRGDGPPKVVARTFITQRGLAKVAELIEREASHLRKAKADSHAAQLMLPMMAIGAQEGRAP